jgi:hypothetical protein
MKPVVQKAGAEGDIDTALEALSRQEVDALLVTADPFFNSRRVPGMALATKAMRFRRSTNGASSRRRAA